MSDRKLNDFVFDYMQGIQKAEDLQDQLQEVNRGIIEAAACIQETLLSNYWHNNSTLPDVIYYGLNGNISNGVSIDTENFYQEQRNLAYQHLSICSIRKLVFDEPPF